MFYMYIHIIYIAQSNKCTLYGELKISLDCLNYQWEMYQWTWLVILQSNKCTDWKFSGLACSYHSVYTAVFFTLHSVILVLTAVLSLILLFNFQVEVKQSSSSFFFNVSFFLSSFTLITWLILKKKYEPILQRESVGWLSYAGLISSIKTKENMYGQIITFFFTHSW